MTDGQRLVKLMGKISGLKKSGILVPNQSTIKKMTDAASTFMRIWPSSKIEVGIDPLLGTKGWITVEDQSLEVYTGDVRKFVDAVVGAENFEFYPTTVDTVRMGIMYDKLMVPEIAPAAA
jgi:hypothetical protein